METFADLFVVVYFLICIIYDYEPALHEIQVQGKLIQMKKNVRT